jgi:ankyrin repeat protein
MSSPKYKKDKVEKKAKFVEEPIPDETALPGAAWNNDLTLVRSILSKESNNVNILNDRSIYLQNSYSLFTLLDQTALYCAARQGHLQILLELVTHKNINPNVICAQGSTALHAACFGGHASSVAILLMSGMLS